MLIYTQYTGRTHNVLDLSLRPFVCPFVRSFICYQLYFENAQTDFSANWHKSSPGARTWTVDLGGQEVKGQGHRRSKLFGSVEAMAETSFSIPWVE